jgi:hypothetical protein
MRALLSADLSPDVKTKPLNRSIRYNSPLFTALDNNNGLPAAANSCTTTPQGS